MGKSHSRPGCIDAIERTELRGHMQMREPKPTAVDESKGLIDVATREKIGDVVEHARGCSSSCSESDEGTNPPSPRR